MCCVVVVVVVVVGWCVWLVGVCGVRRRGEGEEGWWGGAGDREVREFGCWCCGVFAYVVVGFLWVWFGSVWFLFWFGCSGSLNAIYSVSWIDKCEKCVFCNRKTTECLMCAVKEYGMDIQ